MPIKVFLDEDGGMTVSHFPTKGKGKPKILCSGVSKEKAKEAIHAHFQALVSGQGRSDATSSG